MDKCRLCAMLLGIPRLKRGKNISVSGYSENCLNNLDPKWKIQHWVMIGQVASIQSLTTVLNSSHTTASFAAICSRTSLATKSSLVLTPRAAHPCLSLHLETCSEPGVPPLVKKREQREKINWAIVRRKMHKHDEIREMGPSLGDRYGVERKMRDQVREFAESQARISREGKKPDQKRAKKKDRRLATVGWRLEGKKYSWWVVIPTKYLKGPSFLTSD